MKVKRLSDYYDIL
jgi:hypothetical protein